MKCHEISKNDVTFLVLLKEPRTDNRDVVEFRVPRTAHPNTALTTSHEHFNSVGYLSTIYNL